MLRVSVTGASSIAAKAGYSVAIYGFAVIASTGASWDVTFTSTNGDTLTFAGGTGTGSICLPMSVSEGRKEPWFIGGFGNSVTWSSSGSAPDGGVVVYEYI